jgi:hypothetical protein
LPALVMKVVAKTGWSPHPGKRQRSTFKGNGTKPMPSAAAALAAPARSAAFEAAAAAHLALDATAAAIATEGVELAPPTLGDAMAAAPRRAADRAGPAAAASARCAGRFDGAMCCDTIRPNYLHKKPCPPPPPSPNTQSPLNAPHGYGYCVIGGGSINGFSNTNSSNFAYTKRFLPDDFQRTRNNELSTRLCATTNYHENQRPGMVIKHSVAILVQAAPIASPGPRVALAWFRL